MPEKEITIKKESLPETQVDNLISQAITSNASVETMEKLLAMRRELKAEWSKERFDEAMSKLQGEMPIIEKNEAVKNKPEKGGGTRYKFAPIDEIVKIAGPIIAANGFSYLIKTETKGNVIRVVVIPKHINGHSEETEFEVPIDPTAFMTEQQKYASALTYAKRYAFCNAFGIMTGDKDDDSTANEVKETASAQATTGYQPRKGASAAYKPEQKEVNIVDEIKKGKVEINNLMELLGYNPKTKPEAEEIIENICNLKLDTANYPEIIKRLKSQAVGLPPRTKPQEAISGEIVDEPTYVPEKAPNNSAGAKTPATDNGRPASGPQLTLIKNLGIERHKLYNEQATLDYINLFYDKKLTKLTEITSEFAKIIIDDLLKNKYGDHSNQ
jgi:hypothetical protein